MSIQKQGDVACRSCDSDSSGSAGRSREEVAAAVAALDAIDETDPEEAHVEADRILSQFAPPEVRNACARLVKRCSWWAYA